MIRKIFIILFIVYSGALFAQKDAELERINKLETEIDSLRSTIPNLENKVNFSFNDLKLPVFIKVLSKESKVNLSIHLEEDIKEIMLSHDFSDASVRDIILYLCKEYQLTFTVTGNIISLRKFKELKKIKKYRPRDIFVAYDKNQDLFSIDLQNDSLSVAFKKITDVTGKNLVFSLGLEKIKISGYIQNKSFESAIDKIAFSNDLLVTKTKDNYYLFESASESQGSTSLNNNNNNNNNGSNRKTSQKPVRYKKSNFYFKVLDSVNQNLEVDFENTSIESIIKDIGFALKINMFTNTPFNGAGTATVKADNITYDTLLEKILEDSKFTFKKEEGIYYFGDTAQASLRNTVIIPLMHRSIQIMNEPMQSGKSSSGFNSNYNSGSTYNGNNNNSSYGNNNQSNTSGSFNQNNRSNNQRQNVNTQKGSSFGNHSSKAEALMSVLPDEIKEGLEILTDAELNSFIVSGDAQKIEKFRAFIKKIDKPVPVILIEVMILEVKKSNSLSTGLELGIGDAPVNDKGTIFPSTGSSGLTLGANTINKIIGGFSGFGSKNIGKVVPNFYANIQAMESNGNVKIRSTPKLSTLNGHQATLSNGQRTYYAVIRKDIIGSQNPQTTEIKNYVPIDADLSISIKPMVSGDEQITMSINVVQSSFNGERIDPEAPPGMNSREFTSTIRVKDQDVIILGGLEENVKNNSGSGVPFLARIPIIKWLFSKRTRVASKAKLSVLIKPTIIR